jgi:predicted DCC family thiol-disulfide oxidoreductase YuxK
MSTTRLTFLFDGACAICDAEAARLRRWNTGRGTLRFIDISAPDFDPAPYGRTLAELMGRVHAFRPEGEVLVGMDAIRAAYDEVGLGWLLRPTTWPGLRPLFDRLYVWFAGNRYRLSGRVRCNDGRCES